MTAYHYQGPLPLPPDDCPLSDRELEVLYLASTDMTDKQIAEKLEIRVPTAHSHMKNILRKLGYHTRCGAVAHALRQGLIR